MRALFVLRVLTAGTLLTSCTQAIMLGPKKDAISSGDVQQIRRAVSEDRHLCSNVIFIRPLGSDTAAVQSGSAESNGGVYWMFRVRRTHDAWVIDDSQPISAGSTITTD